MTTITSDRILPVNSTTYVDMLGVLAGLERLPGEPSDRFAERIDLAVSAGRGGEYVGLMNSLSVALGLEMWPAMRLSSSLELSLSVTFGALDAVLGEDTLHVDLLALTSDDFWQWKSLRAVAAELARLPALTVELSPRPALSHQLVLQSNVSWVSGEDLSGARTVRLAHGPLVDGSPQFSRAVPAYTVGSDGQTLRFDAPCPAGTAVSYRYRASPYDLVASPVSVFSLTDPNVQRATLGSNGRVIYQAREYVEELLRRDASYWGK